MKTRPPHHRASPHLAVTALALTAATLNGCSETKPAGPTFPGDPYGPVTEPFPTNAHQVTLQEWNDAQSLPGFRRISPTTVQAEFDDATKVEAADDLTILEAEQRTGLTIAPPPPKLGDGVTLLDDGNVSVGVQLGQELTTFTTMGVAWSKHAVANALRTVGTQSNQLALYANIYAKLDPKTITSLGLLDPAIFKAHPDSVTVDKIASLNSTLAANLDAILAQFRTAGPPPILPSCGNDVGDGLAGDQARNRATCGFTASGIMSTLAFPMQGHLTCVKDQGERGTCGAFSTTSAIEAHVHQTYAVSTNLSEQHLYNMGTGQWYPRNLTDGIWPYSLLKNMEEEAWQLPPEGLWNYNPSISRYEHFVFGPPTDGSTSPTRSVGSLQNSCLRYSETCSDTVHQSQMLCLDGPDDRYCGYTVPEKNPERLGYRVTQHTQLWDPTQRDLSTRLLILATAVQQAPIAWSFLVTPEFQRAATGYVPYTIPTRNLGAHAVHLVGYVGNEQLALLLPKAPPASGGGYFIVKNSWTNCYGDGGYAYVPYDAVKVFTNDAVTLDDVR